MSASGVSPLVSFVLYTALVISAITLVVFQLQPTVAEVRDGLALKQARDTLQAFDSAIDTVSLGKHSSTTVPTTLSRGAFIFDTSRNRVYYRLETEQRIFADDLNTTIGTLRYARAENEARVILQYNASTVQLTGEQFSIFPRRSTVVLTNKGMANDTLQIAVRRQ